MNFPDFSSSGGGGNPTPPRKKQIQLQGPRPPQLQVSQESHKIKKPPPHPAVFAQPARPPLPPVANQERQPVIIYAVSPKIIHVKESNYKSVVQSLTGLSSSTAGGDTPVAGEISPAARMASIERTSPTSERLERVIDVSDVMNMVEMPVELGQAPGILSPAPTSLPPIPSGFFSPVNDLQTLSFLSDLSPYWQGSNFLSSPSGLLSASLVSPISSPNIFNNLFDL